MTVRFTQTASKQLAVCTGLLMAAMSVQADDSVEAAEIVFNATESTNGNFDLCSQVLDNSARLACFDKVANNGELPSFLSEKKPLELGKTVVAVFDSVLPNKEQNTETTTLPIAETDVVSVDEMTEKEGAQSLLSQVGVGSEDTAKYTPLSLAYDLDRNNAAGTWKLRPHNAMYVLPIQQHVDPNRRPSSPSQEEVVYSANEQRSSELKYQVSVKTKVAQDLFNGNADLWFGYTQQSHWQIYNEDNSHPFRATDYQPEFFLTQPVKEDLPFGGQLRMLGAGAVHHSNGESDPLSRSWNRVYLMAGAEWGNLTVIPRLTKRLESSNGSKPDDNADIEDFYGFGDVQFFYDFNDQDSLGGMVRLNPSTGKGAIQLDYTHRLDNNLNAYLQLFHGYGESIIDYNYEDTTIGVGLMLNDWKGL